MGTYVIRRLTRSVPVIAVVAFICFAVVRLAPGDPVALLVDVSLAPPSEVSRHARARARRARVRFASATGARWGGGPGRAARGSAARRP